MRGPSLGVLVNPKILTQSDLAENLHLDYFYSADFIFGNMKKKNYVEIRLRSKVIAIYI